MARNPYRGNPSGARALLGSLGMLGARTGDQQAIREAGRAANLIGQGKSGFTKADLRGHSTTPEHPGRKAPDRPQFRGGLTQAERAERRAKEGGPSPFGKSGAQLMSGHTKAQARQAARAAGSKVVIHYRNAKGGWSSLKMTPKQLRGAMRRKGGFYDALAGAIGEYGGSEDIAEDAALGAEVEFYIA